MESTRPIRALMRGLDALTVLNLRDGATVSEVAHEIRLPRTTAYRILETLSNAGFVFRDSADDRYRLTLLVRGLSGGFDDDPWIALVAKPCIVELCSDIVWPVSVGTLSGTTMVLRETTDHGTPLAIERYSAGFRVPLLGSSMGYAFLAFCPAAQREALLDQLTRSNKPEDKQARAPREDLLRKLADVKNSGYATWSRTQRLVEELSLSIPAMAGDRVLATLTVRFAASAVPLNTALERFLPKLQRCAAKMSAAFLESAESATAH